MGGLVALLGLSHLQKILTRSNGRALRRSSLLKAYGRYQTSTKAVLIDNPIANRAPDLPPGRQRYRCQIDQTLRKTLPVGLAGWVALANISHPAWEMRETNTKSKWWFKRCLLNPNPPRCNQSSKKWLKQFKTTAQLRHTLPSLMPFLK